MIEATITRLLEAVCPQTYPVVAPKSKSAPFITYTRISTPRLRDLSGPAGMAMPRFQVDVYAADYDTARALAVGVRTALDGYSDTEVRDINLINEQDMSDQTSNPDLTRVMLEFRITHRE